MDCLTKKNRTPTFVEAVTQLTLSEITEIYTSEDFITFHLKSDHWFRFNKKSLPRLLEAILEFQTIRPAAIFNSSQISHHVTKYCRKILKKNSRMIQFYIFATNIINKYLFFYSLKFSTKKQHATRFKTMPDMF